MRRSWQFSHQLDQLPRPAPYLDGLAALVVGRQERGLRSLYVVLRERGVGTGMFLAGSGFMHPPGCRPVSGLLKPELFTWGA